MGKILMIPYLIDTKESYVKRKADNHLFVAELHHKLGNNRSMWLALFYYAMSEDLYGQHWDTIKEKKYESR